MVLLNRGNVLKVSSLNEQLASVLEAVSCEVVDMNIDPPAPGALASRMTIVLDLDPLAPMSTTGAVITAKLKKSREQEELEELRARVITLKQQVLMTDQILEEARAELRSADERDRKTRAYLALAIESLDDEALITTYDDILIRMAQRPRIRNTRVEGKVILTVEQ